MSDRTDAAPAAAQPNVAVPFEKLHTGVGFTLYLALGLIALTLLMLVARRCHDRVYRAPGRALGRFSRRPRQPARGAS